MCKVPFHYPKYAAVHGDDVIPPRTQPRVPNTQQIITPSHSMGLPRLSMLFQFAVHSLHAIGTENDSSALAGSEQIIRAVWVSFLRRAGFSGEPKGGGGGEEITKR
jgi:hypothetical protein